MWLGLERVVMARFKFVSKLGKIKCACRTKLEWRLRVVVGVWVAAGSGAGVEFGVRIFCFFWGGGVEFGSGIARAGLSV